MVLAHDVHEVGHAHPVADGPLDLGQEQVDGPIPQIAGELAQHVRRRDVEVGRRANVEDDGCRLRIRTVDGAQDRAPCDVRVEEVQRRVDPEHEEPGDGVGARVALHVGVRPLLAVDLSEDGDVRPARAVEQHHHGEEDGDDEPDEDGRGDDAHEGRHGENEVRPA